MSKTPETLNWECDNCEFGLPCKFVIPKGKAVIKPNHCPFNIAMISKWKECENVQDRLATSEAMLFKHGSGTGTDLSTLRSSREKLSGGGSKELLAYYFKKTKRGVLLGERTASSLVISRYGKCREQKTESLTRSKLHRSKDH